jgi:hypothetical protein
MILCEASYIVLYSQKLFMPAKKKIVPSPKPAVHVSPGIVSNRALSLFRALVVGYCLVSSVAILILIVRVKQNQFDIQDLNNQIKELKHDTMPIPAKPAAFQAPAATSSAMLGSVLSSQDEMLDRTLGNLSFRLPSDWYLVDTGASSTSYKKGDAYLSIQAYPAGRLGAGMTATPIKNLWFKAAGVRNPYGINEAPVYFYKAPQANYEIQASFSSSTAVLEDLEDEVGKAFYSSLSVK